MRRAISALLVGGGTIMAAAGGIAAAYLGSDSTVDLGTRRVTTQTAAVVAGAGVFTAVGPTLVVTVVPHGETALFVGIAEDIDARSFLGDVRHEVADTVDVPLNLTTRTVGERGDSLPGPRTVNMWRASTTGADRTQLRWPTDHGNWNLILARADGAPGIDADINVALEFNGAIGYALAAVSWGLCIAAGGIYLLRRRSERPPEDSGEAPELISDLDESGAPSGATQVLARGGDWS